MNEMDKEMESSTPRIVTAGAHEPRGKAEEQQTLNDNQRFFQLIEARPSDDETPLLHVLSQSCKTKYMHRIHKWIILKGFRIMKNPKFNQVINNYFPFMSHTNFKILLFLSLVGYSYFKMKNLTPSNHQIYRMIDNVSGNADHLFNADRPHWNY